MSNIFNANTRIVSLSRENQLSSEAFDFILRDYKPMRELKGLKDNDT